MHRAIRAFSLTTGLVLGVAAAGQSEVLITVDGQQIQTRGPFEVRGQRILYTTPAGQYVGVRASLIDLVATEAANRPAEVKDERDLAAERERAKAQAVVIPQTSQSSARSELLSHLFEVGPAAARLEQADRMRLVEPLMRSITPLRRSYAQSGAVTADAIRVWVAALPQLSQQYARRASTESRPEWADAYREMAQEVDSMARNCANPAVCTGLMTRLLADIESSPKPR